MLAMAPLFLALTACERVVGITIPEGPTRLVVEARLELVRGAAASTPPGTQTVRLTTTDAFFANRAAPPARGASVQVVDALGTLTRFTESAAEPGVFTTSALTPVLGRRYVLRIVWQGDTYEASETVRPVAPIDSLWFGPRLSSQGPSTGLRATIAFTDPPAMTDFYLWDQFVDGQRSMAPNPWNPRATSSDELMNGQEWRAAQPYAANVVTSGQQVLVRQMAISEPGYLYFTTVNYQTTNNGSPFGAPPASLRGNIANLTMPSNRALGFFLAGQVSEARRIVP